MRVCVSLFGALRQYYSEDDIEVDVIEGARIADLHHTLGAHGQAHWATFRAGLLRVSAFASDTTPLCDDDSVPADGRIAILPPGQRRLSGVHDYCTRSTYSRYRAWSHPCRGRTRFRLQSVTHHALIWKNEIFTDGESEWNEGCSLCNSAHAHARDGGAARHETS